MKTIFYILSFYFFLFGLGNDYAYSAQNIQSSITENCNSKLNQTQFFKTKEYSFIVIEFTDIELEEDYHNDDNLDTATTLILNKYWKSNCQLNLDTVFVSYLDNNYNPTNTSLSLLTSPLYLKNNVFRI
jgi:hypothetical protein